MGCVVNVHAAKTHLSRLIDRAAEGEEIIIARAGKPVARLAPLEVDRKPRRPGLMRGRITIPKDFDAPLPKSCWTRSTGGPSSLGSAGGEAAARLARLPLVAPRRSATLAPGTGGDRRTRCERGRECGVDMGDRNQTLARQAAVAGPARRDARAEHHGLRFRGASRHRASRCDGSEFASAPRRPVRPAARCAGLDRRPAYRHGRRRLRALRCSGAGGGGLSVAQQRVSWPRPHSASWKMTPRLRRSPAVTRLTPWRTVAR